MCFVTPGHFVPSYSLFQASADLKACSDRDSDDAGETAHAQELEEKGEDDEDNEGR